MKHKAFLGIDVSKGYADFILLNEQKEVIEAGFQLQDNSVGRQQLKDLIGQWFCKGIEQLCCGVESTGGYENNWYSLLKGLSAKMNIHVVRLNAKGVKAASDASLKRTITDAVSAHNIACYLISFPEKIIYMHGELQGIDLFTEGRQHNSYIRMLQKQKVQLNNQLEKLLYQHFAEILIYCRHGVPRWLLRMLGLYCCAAAVVKAGPMKLSEIKGIGMDKARALIQKASQSTERISSQIQHVIAATSKEILHKEQLIGNEKAYLTRLYEDQEQVKLLNSIKGVGVESAVILMLEIEDISRFESAKKLAAYFGVHPTFKQSGDGTWGSHMSKKGRSEVRAVLYMTALSGIRCNPLFKKIYARHRAKAMKHYQAMGVVMHKLLRIIYGILKHKTTFDPKIDEENIRKSAEKTQQMKEEKSREEKKYRYQALTTDGPLSRRAAQKRKKQIAS